MNVQAVAAFWPPTGIALALLLIWGCRLWPGIFIGAFLVNFNTQHSWGTALCIATGNTLEALVAAGLVRKWANGLNCFERMRMTVMFIFLTAIVSTMVSATIGTITLIMGNYAAWNQCWMVWQTWWVGDMTSDLVFTPLLLVWITMPLPRWNANQLLEGAGLLTITVFSGQGCFFWRVSFCSFSCSGTIGLSGHSTAFMGSNAVWSARRGLVNFRHNLDCLAGYVAHGGTVCNARQKSINPSITSLHRDDQHHQFGGGRGYS